MPVGTTVIDEDTRSTMGDMDRRGGSLLVARGGQRGFGNAHFKSSTNRAPRRTTAGGPGANGGGCAWNSRSSPMWGLVGMPNAGKSTLISRVSASKPKIADYPFTTLIPNLGVVRAGAEASFVMADMPGLIAGAAQGAGLGFRFLKHLSRTTLLLHLVDGAPADGSDPVRNCQRIEAELFAYSDVFREREIHLVATKLDLPDAADTVARLRAAFPDRPCCGISAVTGQGVDALVAQAMAAVRQHRRRVVADAAFAADEQQRQQRIAADVLRRAFTERRRRGGADGA